MIYTCETNRMPPGSVYHLPCTHPRTTLMVHLQRDRRALRLPENRTTVQTVSSRMIRSWLSPPPSELRFPALRCNAVTCISKSGQLLTSNLFRVCGRGFVCLSEFRLLVSNVPLPYTLVVWPLPNAASPHLAYNDCDKAFEFGIVAGMRDAASRVCCRIMAGTVSNGEGWSLR